MNGKADGTWVKAYLAKGKTYDELEKALARKTVAELKAIASDIGFAWEPFATRKIAATQMTKWIKAKEHEKAEAIDGTDGMEEDIEEKPIENGTSLVVASHAVLTTRETCEEASEARFLTLEDVRYIFEGIGDIVGMAFDEIKADAPDLAMKVGNALLPIGFGCLDILDVLAFWIPELMHRLLFWAVWILRPEVAVRAKRACRWASLTGHKARRRAQGLWGATKALWRMREELINEYRECAA